MSNHCKGSGVGQHEWWQATIAADDRSPSGPHRLVLYCQRCAEVRSVAIPETAAASEGDFPDKAEAL